MAKHPSSMTGYARRAGHSGGLTWVWEARSVNAKGLDVRLRLPPGHEALDLPARQAAKKALARGSVNIQLTIEREAGAANVRLNEELVEQLRAFARQVDGPAAGPLGFADMLAVRGVVEPAGQEEEDPDSTNEALLHDLQAALDALGVARREEGARLTAVLDEQLATLGSLVATAREIAGGQPEKIRARLKEQLAVILEEERSLPEEKLVQEVAVLATRADITEEMDRLEAHLQQARDLLASAEPVGRRLDFLCQELNREANTLCSKSTELALTRCGMELKALIEQFREQVQNIE